MKKSKYLQSKVEDRSGLKGKHRSEVLTVMYGRTIEVLFGSRKNQIYFVKLLL